MKLKRLENGAYYFLVVIDPQREEVRLGSIDLGEINADELIVVPKSTLAGLIGARPNTPEISTLTQVREVPQAPMASPEPGQSDVSVSRAVTPAATAASPPATPAAPAPVSTAAVRTKPRRDYQPGDLLSRKEAAEYLGVSEKTLAVWKCTARYPLPCIKIGRLVKYKKCELDEFVEKLRAGVDTRRR